MPSSPAISVDLTSGYYDIDYDMIPDNNAGETSIVITFDFKYKWAD